MTSTAPRHDWRRRLWLAALAMITSLGLSSVVVPSPASAEELVDLTLLFQGSVQGKIAPCG